MEPSICKEGGVDPQSLSWGSTSPESSLLRPVFTYHPPTPSAAKPRPVSCRPWSSQGAADQQAGFLHLQPQIPLVRNVDFCL